MYQIGSFILHQEGSKNYIVTSGGAVRLEHPDLLPFLEILITKKHKISSKELLETIENFKLPSKATLDFCINHRIVQLIEKALPVNIISDAVGRQLLDEAIENNDPNKVIKNDDIVDNAINIHFSLGYDFEKIASLVCQARKYPNAVFVNSYIAMRHLIIDNVFNSAIRLPCPLCNILNRRGLISSPKLRPHGWEDFFLTTNSQNGSFGYPVLPLTQLEKSAAIHAVYVNARRLFNGINAIFTNELSLSTECNLDNLSIRSHQVVHSRLCDCIQPEM